MAKNLERTNRINLISFRQFSYYIALVCLLKIHQASGIKCGVLPELPLSSRILNGTETRPGEWPFIAALYRTNSSTYFCGGTIISRRHVLTAAHCIYDKGAPRKLSNHDIEVRLGAYNLTAKDENHVVRINVTEIHLHDGWNVKGEKYDADIAILELSDNVTFSRYIQPICLPAESANVSSGLIDISGTIVGWGLDQNNVTHEAIPKSANVDALNGTYCFLTYNTVSISSMRTFCAIGDGTPNRGDSGGGLFVDTGPVWEQYGIISAIPLNADHQVDKTAAVYTNVYIFRNWIMERIGQYEEKEEEEELIKINLNCLYVINKFGRYACNILDLNITENTDIESFTGSHLEFATENNTLIQNPSYDHVKWIYFTTGTMVSLPNGVGRFFKNLETIVVFPSLSARLIARTNLQNLENLKNLLIYKNEIEILQYDTLWDLPALESFDLTNNKLKDLDQRTFEKNERLIHVDLGSNLLQFLPRNIFKANQLLQWVDLAGNLLNNIATDFTALTNVNNIFLRGNVCVDACFSRSETCNSSKPFTNLSEFQRDVTRNCRPSN